MKESNITSLAGSAISAGLDKTAVFPVTRGARAWLTEKAKQRGFAGGAARFARGATVPLTMNSAAAVAAPVALGVGQTYAVHRMTKNMRNDMRRWDEEDMQKQAFVPAPRALRMWLAKASRTPGALTKSAPTGPTQGLGPAGNRSFGRRAASTVRGFIGPASWKTVGAATAPFVMGHLQGKAIDAISNRTFNKSQEEDRR